ncbi:MAG: right-handed parallel beta-helix repeat-containing protein [Verrucomicrobiaceae bacterium]|nr:right-handed parallel beta-helix repeat-containing protein [Verrucomicrobiaceae bacterium]
MKSKLYSAFTALFCAFTILGQCTLFAADRFVSPTGNDSAAGTLNAPWKTIQKAANTAKAGDVVYIRGGTYVERVQINVSGTATNRIVFRNYEDERPVIDLATLSAAQYLTAGIRITDKNYVTIEGIEICNYRTSSDAAVPAGIMVTGGCTGIMLVGNYIHHIEQNNPETYNYDANAHGIAVYGNSNTAIEGIIICQNQLNDLRLGASEAIVVNGNVNNFQICNNVVHHVNNIAIDAIGYEGTCPTASKDRARNGLIAGNKVWATDSSTNPAYGGNFTSGGGARAAAGIYVDGGTKVVIERNEVWGSNFGVEVASEAEDGVTDYITVRNNIIRHNDGAGIIMGGYDENRGSTENCTIANNTIYMNDVQNVWAGQIQFQFYVKNNKFLNNIIWANPSTKQMIVHYPGSDTATAAQKEFDSSNVFAYNLYYTVGGSAADAGFVMFTGGSIKGFDGISAWQRSGKVAGDVGSTFSNPKFVGGTPSITATASQFCIARGSSAINTGTPSAQYAVTSAQRDFFGLVRLKNARLDRGADEF